MTAAALVTFRRPLGSYHLVLRTLTHIHRELGALRTPNIGPSSRIPTPWKKSVHSSAGLSKTTTIIRRHLLVYSFVEPVGYNSHSYPLPSNTTILISQPRAPCSTATHWYLSSSGHRSSTSSSFSQPSNRLS